MATTRGCRDSYSFHLNPFIHSTFHHSFSPEFKTSFPARSGALWGVKLEMVGRSNFALCARARTSAQLAWPSSYSLLEKRNEPQSTSTKLRENLKKVEAGDGEIQPDKAVFDYHLAILKGCFLPSFSTKSYEQMQLFGVLREGNQHLFISLQLCIYGIFHCINTASKSLFLIRLPCLVFSISLEMSSLVNEPQFFLFFTSKASRRDCVA